MAIKKKIKAEPVPVERPTLVDIIYMLQGEAKGVLPLEQWHRIIYDLSTEPNAPKVLTGLTWQMQDGLLQSHDLNYMLSFMQALAKHKDAVKI